MRLLLIAAVVFLFLAACGGEDGQERSVEEIVAQTSEKDLGPHELPLHLHG